MLQKLIITCLVVLCHNNSMAQYRFVKYYDNPGLNTKTWDTAKDIIQLEDSSYIFPCITSALHLKDTLGYAVSYIQIKKVNSKGDTIWSKLYRRPKHSLSIWNINAMQDSNLLLTGHTFDLVKQYNDTLGSFILLVKIDQNGDTLWTKTINIGDGDEFVEKVIQTNDKGFALVGQVCDKKETNCDMYLMKLDSNAKLMWYKTFTWDAKFWEYPTSLINVHNEYILTAATESLVDNKVYGIVIKTNASGEILWKYKLDNEGQQSSYINDLTYDSLSNQYILAGYIGDNTLIDPIGFGWYLKLDTSGNILKNKKVGEYNRFTSFSNLIKLSNSIILRGGSNVNTIGSSRVDNILYSYDNFDNLIWGRVYTDEPNFQVLYTTKTTKDGGFAMIGFGDSPQDSVHNQDVLFIKVDKRGCLYTDCPSVGIEEDKEGINSSLIIYPNPNNGMFRIKTNLSLNTLEVYNTLGSRVKLLNNFTSEEIDLSNLSKGIYLLRFRDQDGLYYKERLSIE